MEERERDAEAGIEMATRTICFTIDRCSVRHSIKTALIQTINTSPVDGGEFLSAQSSISSKGIFKGR